jgi:hypothetical protein
MTHADVTAEFDRAGVSATSDSLDAEYGLSRAGYEHEFDALSAQERSEFRDFDVEADDDDAAHAAE